MKDINDHLAYLAKTLADQRVRETERVLRWSGQEEGYLLKKTAAQSEWVGFRVNEMGGVRNKTLKEIHRDANEALDDLFAVIDKAWGYALANEEGTLYSPEPMSAKVRWLNLYDELHNRNQDRGFFRAVITYSVPKPAS